MLKITVADSEGSKTIMLEGKITGPWVHELDLTWQSLEHSLGSKKLLLDLRNVDFIDAHGNLLLRDIYRQTKACFLTNSPLTQYFAEVAMRNSAEKKGA